MSPLQPRPPPADNQDHKYEPPGLENKIKIKLPSHLQDPNRCSYYMQAMKNQAAEIRNKTSIKGLITHTHTYLTNLA